MIFGRFWLLQSFDHLRQLKSRVTLLGYMYFITMILQENEQPKIKRLKKNLQNFRLDEEVNPGHLYKDHTQCLGFNSQSSLRFFKFFFNHSCGSFHWEDPVHFHDYLDFIRSSKFDSFHISFFQWVYFLTWRINNLELPPNLNTYPTRSR